MARRRFYGKAGKEYELFKLACPHFEDLQNRIGKLISKEYKNSKLKKIKVLEVGCGPGYTTLIILDSDKRTRVTAIDNEIIMIQQAKEILKQPISKDRVILKEADALEFLKNIDSDSFEVFASAFTLHNFEKVFRKKVLKEIYRVLKKGGIFINADKYALDDNKEHKKTLDWQLNKFKEKYGEINREDLAKEWTTHYLEDNKLKVIMKEKESIRFMENIGFNNVKIVFRKQMEAILFAKKLK